MGKINPTSSYSGLNVQFPISQLILIGEKTVETRSYPVPSKLLGKNVLVIETPGKIGKFKSRIVAIVNIVSCFQYPSEAAFKDDMKRHRVAKDSIWAWNNKKEKWGWEIRVVKVFKKPLPMKKRTGIVYTNNIKI